MKLELCIVIVILLVLALVVCGGCVEDEVYAAKVQECEWLRDDWNALQPKYKSLQIDHAKAKEQLAKDIGAMVEATKTIERLTIENQALLEKGTPDPNQQVWGQGAPSSEWQGFFGNDNMAKLNFVQTQTLNKQGQIMAELVERVRRLEVITAVDPNVGE